MQQKELFELRIWGPDFESLRVPDAIRNVYRPSHWLSFLDRVEKPSPESQDFGDFALSRAVAEEMDLARNVT